MGATTYQAEAATRAGAAAVANNTWSSGGKCVGSIGNGSGNTLTFQVNAPAAGRYVMNVRDANNQVSGSGNYNLQQLLRLRARHRQGDRRAAQRLTHRRPGSGTDPGRLPRSHFFALSIHSNDVRNTEQKGDK
ncbi:hypothetical protein [Streptomyces sp. AC555_RSS877]|uniref:hypothetical protein n=1 Tax=Streptomyces sp. AC555_RSS877 TaxID=2823688 RepID=UPI001C261A2A|nr:hypothetical protein [Streptomyces sp. AC555_RSS877]